MRQSWRLALNILAARPGRTVLLAAAVMLSSALIVSVSSAIGSAQAGLDLSLRNFLGAADARVIHGGSGRFDADVLETVRGWPEVRMASGRLGASLTIAAADAPVDPASGLKQLLLTNAVGIDFELEPRVRRFSLVDGRMPSAPDEILIDPITAEELEVGPGDRVEVARLGEPLLLEVAGVYDRQKLGTLQRARVYLDRERLAEASGRRDRLTSIYVILEEGEEVEAFCARHLSELPEALMLEPAELVRTGFDQRVRASRIGLVISTMLTFMSAGFIIVTGLASGVTERQREMAILRCIGASRRHLFVAQILVGLFTGIAGVTLGIPLGLALTGLLVTIVPEYLPAGVRVPGFGVTLAVIGSLAAGGIGAVAPAIAASRVAPLEAMTRAARPVRRGALVACGVGAVACVAVQIVLFLPGDPELRFWIYAAAGLPICFIGFFLAGVPTLQAITRLAAGPLSRVLRLPPGMLAGSLLATPLRHGFTAGALMIGLALLVDTWASGVSVLEDWVGKIRFADGFAFRAAGITPEQQRMIADLPFVEDTCPIGYLPVQIVDRRVFGLTGLTPSDVVCIGFDPERFFSINAIEWIEGDPETAIGRLQSGEGVIVAERFLTAKGVGVGDRLRIASGRVNAEFEIVGVVSSAGLDIATQLFGIRSAYMQFAVSCVFMDYKTVGDVFDYWDATMLQINLADSVTDEEATRRINAAIPGVSFRSGRWILGTINDIGHALMTVESIVAYAALVLAALAMGNVLAANIHGRRFEYGVLRAVGAPPGMLIRLILGEAFLLAITGTVVGTVFGFHLAWIDATHLRDLAGLPVGVALPWAPIVTGWLVLVGVTLLVALPGALRLAARPPTELVAGGRND